MASTEIPVATLTPLDDVEVKEYNFKKQPLQWITQTILDESPRFGMTAERLADIQGVHVQTIKRALDTMEKTDGVDILYDGEAWHSMMLETIITGYAEESPIYHLFVSCTRSKTGRYARGSPIVFMVLLEDSPEYEAARMLFTTLPSMSPEDEAISKIEEALEHVTISVSNDAEIIDFDARAEAEAEWAALENDMEAIPMSIFFKMSLVD